MNTIRMFAFAAAILITAALFAVVADAFISDTPGDTAAAVHAPADGVGP
jgi:hypothetical protein